MTVIVIVIVIHSMSHHAHFHRPDTGIHTVEGNVAGPRAAQLAKKRQEEQLEFDAKKRKLEIHRLSTANNNDNTNNNNNNNNNQAYRIDTKFAGAERTSQAEHAFRVQTVGLVTAEEFIQAQQQADGLLIGAATTTGKSTSNVVETGPTEAQRKAEQNRKRIKKIEQKQRMSKLSFAHEEELIDDMKQVEKTTTEQPSLKDPTIDTSFLPDKQRDQEKELERRRLQQEWNDRQHSVRQEQLEIIYSYWDGSGHRRSVTVQKGDTIGTFLEIVRKDLSKEFREMQAIACDALIYVKEDLMLPQDLTFYDFIATKARGKSGPLFHFDVHDDLRVGPLDSRVEKDESHPGKVVARQWYDRNKHIFPASRWELYDPTKTFGNYTIHGGEVNKKE